MHMGGSAESAVSVTRRPTTVSLQCADTPVPVGTSTTCTATVSDVGPGQPSTPTKTVTFNGGKNDSFAGNPCTLSGTGPTASCQVTYTPTATGTGSHTITARYVGDKYHQTSRGSITVPVTG
jgi:hypothetical protein